MIVDTIATRVARGVALLDKQLPGWEQRIDLDRLDIASPCQCILGQTWTGDVPTDSDPYLEHADELFGDHWEASFTDPTDILHGFNGATVKEDAWLNAEWRRVVQVRRDGAS